MPTQTLSLVIENGGVDPAQPVTITTVQGGGSAWADTGSLIGSTSGPQTATQGIKTAPLPYPLIAGSCTALVDAAKLSDGTEFTQAFPGLMLAGTAGSSEGGGSLAQALVGMGDGMGGDMGDSMEQSGGSTAPVPDLDIVLGPPVFDIAEQNSLCEAGSPAFVHVLFAATYSDTGFAYDPTGTPPQIAITSADPEDADWQTGDWLTRTAPTFPGLYARLALTETPPVGRYRVYVKLGIEILRALGYLDIE